MKPVDWIVLAVVVLGAALAICFAVRKRRRGGCCNGCAGCAQNGCCQNPQKKADK